MAASTMTGVPYMQLGPRQGVYCRPSVVLTSLPGGGYEQQYLTVGGGRLKWRLSQFKSPEQNYRLRARADPEEYPPTENIPQIPGKIIERPSSAVSRQRPSAPARSPVKMTKSRSSSNLHRTSSSSLVMRQSSTGPQTAIGAGRFNGAAQQEKHRKSSTAPVFSVHASAVTIQSRTFARSLKMPPRKTAPPEEPFSYPDPIRVGGDQAFNVRLAEMAGLQRDTVKIEETRARIYRRNSTITTPSVASSSVNNNTSSNAPSHNSHQLNRPSSGVTAKSIASKSSINRTPSLPSGPTTTTTHRPTLPPSKPKPDPVTPKHTSASPTQPNDSKRENGPRKGSSSPVTTHKTPPEVESLTSEYFNEIPSPKDGPKIDKPQIDMNPSPAIKAVEPKTHHRELVEAIFSGPSPPQSNTSREKATLQDKQDSVVVQITPGAQKVESGSTKSTSTRKSSGSRPKSSKSKQTSTTSSKDKASPPSLPCSPTTETRPPSSASSSSTTSDRPASGRKSSTKSPKTRKLHKKSTTSRHKNT